LSGAERNAGLAGGFVQGLHGHGFPEHHTPAAGQQFNSFEQIPEHLPGLGRTCHAFLGVAAHVFAVPALHGIVPTLPVKVVQHAPPYDMPGKGDEFCPPARVKLVPGFKECQHPLPDQVIPFTGDEVCPGNAPGQAMHYSSMFGDVNTGRALSLHLLPPELLVRIETVSASGAVGADGWAVAP